MKAPVDLNAIHLETGAHKSPEDGMCVMEAVAWIRHQEDPSVPFNDAPACVSSILRSFATSFNDGLPDVERQELKRFIPLLPGTAGDRQADEKRAWMATDWLVRTYTPKLLRMAGLDEQATRLENLAQLDAETTPTIQPTLDAIRKDAAAARAAAWAAAWAAARDAARDAAEAAARAAARDAAWAAAWAAARDAAEAAARDAAGAAARAAAEAAAWAAARDAARDAAWDAARDAARDAAEGKPYGEGYTAARKVLDPIMQEKFAPLRDELNASAFDLFERMIKVGSEELATG